MAKLHFKYGAMGAGKSAELLQVYHDYNNKPKFSPNGEEQDLLALSIKPKKDLRDNDMIVSRSGVKSQKADIFAGPELDLRQATDEKRKELGRAALSCVLIDEAQFLEHSQVEQLFKMSKIDDISVIAYGLKTDFKNDFFPGSNALIKYADQLEEIETMCGCNNQARFNLRLLNGEPIFEGEQELLENQVEGMTYTSVCGGCYIKAGGVA